MRKWLINNPLKFLGLFYLLPFTGICQTSDGDLARVGEVKFGENEFQEVENTFLLSGKKDLSPWVRYNPAAWTLAGLMYGYQEVISPQISSKCSYRPTCSRFSAQAIQRFGIFKGLALSADRLTRCSHLAAKDISPLNVNEDERKIINKPKKYQVSAND